MSINTTELELDIKRALENDSTLIELNWENRRPTREHLKLLGIALAKNTILKSLGLSNNDLKCEDILPICQGLEENTTLITLDLSKNKIRNLGGYYLSNMIRKNASIRTLNLYKNPIEGSGMDNIYLALENNSAITSLTPSCPSELIFTLTTMLSAKQKDRDSYMNAYETASLIDRETIVQEFHSRHPQPADFDFGGDFENPDRLKNLNELNTKIAALIFRNKTIQDLSQSTVYRKEPTTAGALTSLVMDYLAPAPTNQNTMATAASTSVQQPIFQLPGKEDPLSHLIRELDLQIKTTQYRCSYEQAKLLEKRSIKEKCTLIVINTLNQCRTKKEGFEIAISPELAFRRASATGKLRVMQDLNDNVLDLDINEPGASGKTARDFAIENKQTEAVALIDKLTNQKTQEDDRRPSKRPR